MGRLVTKEDGLDEVGPRGVDVMLTPSNHMGKLLSRGWLAVQEGWE